MDAVTVLQVLGLPLLVGVTGWALARRCRSRAAGLIAGMTVVLAVLVVHVVLIGWPRVPPHQSLDLLVLIVVVAALPAAARGPGLSRVLLIILAGAPVWFLLGRLPGMELSVRSGWSAATGLVLLLLWWPLLSSLGAAAGTTADVAVVDTNSGELSGSDALAAMSARLAVGPGVLAVVAAGAAAEGLFSHSLKLAELSAALAVCLGVFAAATLLRPSQPISRGTSLTGSVILAALLVYDLHFLETPPGELALLLGGWLSWQVAGRFSDRGAARTRQLRGILWASLPVLAAVLIGFLRYRAEALSDPYS